MRKNNCHKDNINRQDNYANVHIWFDTRSEAFSCVCSCSNADQIFLSIETTFLVSDFLSLQSYLQLCISIINFLFALAEAFSNSIKFN